jgi:hypothetical protein
VALNSDKGVFGCICCIWPVLAQAAVRAPVILLVVYDLGALGANAAAQNRGRAAGMMHSCPALSSKIGIFFFKPPSFDFFRSLPPTPAPTLARIVRMTGI